MLSARHEPGPRCITTGTYKSTLVGSAYRYEQSHILIDDDGNARLTATIHSSIIADSGASTSDRAQVSTDSIEETRDFCYSAPEIEWPENRGIDNVTRTRESDVYGMAMVIYEARSRWRVSSGLWVISPQSPRF